MVKGRTMNGKLLTSDGFKRLTLFNRCVTGISIREFGGRLKNQQEAWILMTNK